MAIDPSNLPEDFTWHDSYIAIEPGAVPDILEETQDLVRDMLDEARDHSDDAVQQAQLAIEELRQAQLPSKLPDPPPAPNLITSFNATIGYNPDVPPGLGTLSPEQVTAFSPATIDIPDIASEIEDYVPILNGLTIPSAPVFTLPTAPAAPAVDTTVDFPDAPSRDYGEVPELLELDLPTYEAPTLPVFGDEAPEFTELAPDPFIQWTEPVYSSDIKTAVAAVLVEMLAGGTGIPEDVERAIWERARGRLDRAANKKLEEARAVWASRGHEHPPGMLNAQTIAILDEANQKANEQGMEVAIAQAELEQKNRQFAVQHGISYEQVFVTLFLQIVDRNFQIAKFAVETQIQVFNAKVAVFDAKNRAFIAKIEQFKAELEVALAYLKLFEAQVKAELAKGEINQQRLQAYVAKVQAYNSQVEAYKALVQAEGVRVEIEKSKIEVYRGEIDAYVGQINGQRAAYEAYASRVQAEAAKATLEEANAKAYVAKVQGVAARADIAIKEAEAQIQNNRLQLEWSIANIQRVTAYTGHQLAAIQANAAAYEAQTRRASAKFEADSRIKQVELQTVIEADRNIIAKYQASLEAWRTQAQQILAIATLNSESIRAAGQIAGTLAAGAMAGTNVSAAMSGSAGLSQAKQDSTSRTRSFGQTLSDSANYSVTHTYNHEV